MLLLFLPVELWANALGLVKAHDLINAERAGLFRNNTMLLTEMRALGFRYNAHGVVLSPIELAWFQRQQLTVQLWIQCKMCRKSGKQVWYQNGKLHRDGDLPAIVKANGDQFWFQHGKKHRDNDLPAVVWADGTQEWYQHGELHRDGDRPAVVYASGDQEWYQHGELHRVEADGAQSWYQNGKLHRDGDLPAVIKANGDQFWYQHDMLHRDGNPAIVCTSGYLEWRHFGHWRYDSNLLAFASKHTAVDNVQRATV